MLVVTRGKTVDRDLGRKSILRALNNVDGAHVDVGLFEGEGEDPKGEINMPQLGAIHEFGAGIRHGRSGGMTITVPERSWLRSNHDKHVSKYNARLDKLYGRIISGKVSLLASLTAFGERVASDVRRNITAIREPPNAPATIAKKGSSNPLIDTGAFRNSVRSRVVLAGGIKV